ncbi:MAG: ATP-binding protein, partial [Pseudomonadota bacterium]
ARRLPLLAAAFVTALAAATLFLLDSMDRQRQAQEARTAVAARLSIIRAKLEYALSAPLLRARGVVAQIVAHGGITPQEFETIARVLMKDHDNVRNMIVSHGMVIAMTYPLAGNESVVGVDFRSVPVQYASVQKAIAARASLLQGPVPLIQGGTGLILRTPVFLPDEGGGERFYGMANIVLDVAATFAIAGLDDPDLPIQVAIKGRDGLGAAGEMVYGDAAVFAAAPVEADVELAYGTWRLAAIPQGGWARVEVSTAPRVMAVLAFLAMAGIAFGTAAHVVGQDQARRALARKSRDLEMLIADLERSNADLERFAYVASHDLQTPLRNVTSYAQLLSRRYGGRLDADADAFIGFIVEGSLRMSRLIQDLLEYARVSNSPAPTGAVAAAAAADEALANLAAVIAEAGAEVEVGPLPEVRATPRHLVSLFQNLIGNAIKYRAEDRIPHVRVTARQDQPGWWTFAVADNGIGIDPAYFDQIFTVFQRLHPPGDREGTGIGLALCQRIVHQSGGRLWVESEPGRGATFLFTLPEG